MALEMGTHALFEGQRYRTPVASGPPPRTMFISHIGGDTVIRSSNPERYLMPDIDLMQGGFYSGTVGSRPATVGIEPGGVIVRLFAADEVAVLLSRALDAGVRSLGLEGDLSRVSAFGTPAEAIVALKQLHEPSRLKSIPATQQGELPPFVLAPVLRVPKNIATPKVEARVDATSARTHPTVAEVASRITELSGLTDRQLAAVFRVARETYQRWRTGELTNPTRGNRRRLGLLLRLVEDLEARDVTTRDWLNSISSMDAMTPLDLLERGRLEDVEYLAAQLPSERSMKTETRADGRSATHGSELPAFARRQNEPTEDLILDDDHDWIDIEAEAVSDDE